VIRKRFSHGLNKHLWKVFKNRRIAIVLLEYLYIHFEGNQCHKCSRLKGWQKRSGLSKHFPEYTDWGDKDCCHCKDPNSDAGKDAKQWLIGYQVIGEEEHVYPCQWNFKDGGCKHVYMNQQSLATHYWYNHFVLDE
jgi:hypothetical protein